MMIMMIIEQSMLTLCLTFIDYKYDIIPKVEELCKFYLDRTHVDEVSLRCALHYSRSQ
jgi:hypothetical protein